MCMSEWSQGLINTQNVDQVVLRTTLPTSGVITQPLYKEMSSQGVMSGKKASNNPALCPFVAGIRPEHTPLALTLKRFHTLPTLHHMSRTTVKINADYSRDQLEPVAVLAERYDLNFEMPFRRTSGFKGCRCVFCTFVQFQLHLQCSTPDFSRLLPEIAPSLSMMWATTERPTLAGHRGGKTV